MSLVARICALIALSIFLTSVQAREVNILVLGDGAAANCNSHRFGAVAGVYQVTPDGQTVIARDPLALAGCDGGSVWVPLGQSMISARIADKVVFVPMAFDASSVDDWQVGGRAYRKLMLSVQNLRDRRFDYILWQKNFHEAEGATSDYFNKLRKIVRSISLNIPFDKWIIAEGLTCGDRGSLEQRKAEIQLANNPVLNRYPGPSPHQLDKKFFSTDCKLNEAGQREMAGRWLNSIIAADASSEKYQKEALLYYFR
jgi:hypothetical protein